MCYCWLQQKILLLCNLHIRDEQNLSSVVILLVCEMCCPLVVDMLVPDWIHVGWVSESGVFIAQNLWVTSQDMTVHGGTSLKTWWETKSLIYFCWTTCSTGSEVWWRCTGWSTMNNHETEFGTLHHGFMQQIAVWKIFLVGAHHHECWRRKFGQRSLTIFYKQPLLVENPHNSLVLFCQGVFYCFTASWFSLMTLQQEVRDVNRSALDVVFRLERCGVCHVSSLQRIHTFQQLGAFSKWATRLYLAASGCTVHLPVDFLEAFFVMSFKKLVVRGGEIMFSQQFPIGKFVGIMDMDFLCFLLWQNQVTT